jgi:hypothetical protein
MKAKAIEKTDNYVSKSPDKKKSGTGDLTLKGRAGRGIMARHEQQTMGMPDQYTQNAGSTTSVDIFDESR